MRQSVERTLLWCWPWGTPRRLRLILPVLACVLLWMTTVSDAQTTADRNFSVSPTGSNSNSSAKLAWNPNKESYLAGYNVYRSNQSGVFTSSPLNGSTPVTATSFTDSTVQSGQTYYYVVRAISKNGMEGANSNQVQFPAPQSTNQSPTVSAEANQTITLPASATVSGSVTGVPTGKTATVIWTKTSGPGTVTFANANAASTMATFSTPGTYVLTLTATAAGLTSSSSVTLTMNAASWPTGPTMAWDPGSTSNVAGYNVYRSSQAGVFTSAPLNGSTLLTVPSFTDSTVQNGNTYYYTVRAVSTSGMESPNSNVIQVLR